MVRNLGLFIFGVSLAATSVAVVACDSSSTSSETATTQDVKKPIKAAEGGVISDAKGEVTLQIPPGALAQDTEITLAVGAPELGAQSNVYDFGPDGTKFSKPAALTVKFSGAAPDGKKAVLAVYDGAAWKPLSGSSAANGAVMGNVDHFSKFAVVFVDGQVSVTGCADVVKNFTACGGDPKGTWKYRDVCADVPIGSGDNPFAQICPDAKFEAEVTIEGTVTVTATDYSQSVLKTTTTSITKIPSSCYGALQATSCTEVGSRLQLDSCAEEAGVCVCKKSEIGEDPAESKPYTLEGNTIKTDSSTTEFCVKGNTLEISSVDAQSGKREAVIVLEKQ